MRDAAFSRVVRESYDRTCSMTGLQLIAVDGSSEVEAAHIRPVAEDGPDSPRNGLALSSTAHWLFDHGLLSVADNGTILVVKNRVPEKMRSLLNANGIIRPPEDPKYAPHVSFLRWHREHRYKG